jgi:3-methylcrotonyl-CoA carboxylase alpha subunit
VREGDAVTPFYDPMIAKIIVWDEDRGAALARLRRALADTAVLGVITNLGFLARLASHSQFAAAEIDTGFIERHRPDLIPPRRPSSDAALAAAVLARLQGREAAAKAAAANAADPFTPWARTGGWRLGGSAPQEIVFRDGEEERTVAAERKDNGWLLRLGDRQLVAVGKPRPDGTLSMILDGVRRKIAVLEHGLETAVFADGESWRLVEIDPFAAVPGDDPTAGRLTAPMPGRVIRQMAEVGKPVRRGEALMIIEAMKMEHTITAPADGVIEAVRFAVGDLVEEGAELISLVSDRQSRS